MDGSGKQGGGEWCITDSETSVCFALWNFTTIPLNLRNIDRLIFVFFLSSEIRQKDQSQKECFKKTEHTKFSEKRIFLNVRVRIRGGGGCSLFLKFGSVLRFALLLHYRRFLRNSIENKLHNDTPVTQVWHWNFVHW